MRPDIYLESIRIVIIVIILLQISCSAAVSSFITGAAGNIFSDTIDRQITSESDCKGQVK
mgnify:FL=1